MKRLLIALAFSASFVAPALAACPSPLTGKDASGTTQNFGVTVDASGNCYGNISIVDGSAAANKATVDSSGRLSVLAIQPTAANLNATVVGTGTFAMQLTGATNNINNIAGTVSLPTGAATSALQTTGNSALTTINTTLGTPMQNSGGSVTANAGTNLNTSALATSANQTNKTQFTQLTDGTNAAATYTGYGTAPTGNVPAVNAFVTNATALGAAAIASSSPVTAATINVTPTDCSGTVTSGGTAQNAFSAQATLHGFTIVNIDTSAAEALWISFTTTAAANTAQSYMLNPASATASGGSFITPLGFGVNTAPSVIGATTGHKYSCTRW